MSTTDLFRGAQNDSDGWLLAGGYFILVLGGFIALDVFFEPAERVLGALTVLGLLFVLVPVLGLINAVRGCTYPSSLAIGAIPMIAWLLITVGKVLIGVIVIGPITLFGQAIVFTTIGLIASLGGFSAGYLGRKTVAKYT